MIVTEAEVRSFLGRRYQVQFEALGIDPAALPADFDLLDRSVIDSLGLIELVAAIDAEFGLAVDFEDMDPEQLSVVGPICRFVAEASGQE